MRRSKVESLFSANRKTCIRFLAVLGLVYLLFLAICEFPFVSRRTELSGAGLLVGGDAVGRRVVLGSEEETQLRSAPVRPFVLPHRWPKTSSASAPAAAESLEKRRHRGRSPIVSGLDFVDVNRSSVFSSELDKSAREAWEMGRKVFEEIGRVVRANTSVVASAENCLPSISLTGDEFSGKGNLLLIPCGMTLGSHITLVARPRIAHPEYDPKIVILKEGEQNVMVSQFMMELQGLKTVDGEDPPRILHFNPRLKGDWSDKPVIEQNTCYRMQWGSAQRCEGWKSKADEETVDGLPKCEKWIRDDDSGVEESKMAWWLNRLMGRTRKVTIDWPYPFVEDKLFVLTLSAGLEGYHVNVDGRHVTSFPYRTGFVLEDATGLSLNGDIDVQSIFAASLPSSHPSFAPQRHLEMSARWKALSIPKEPVELFIGILSAGNHFAERMAVRKSWMSAVRKSPNLVARFFVALNARKEINVELKKEAEYFGDIVIVPFMDSYDLVVLKTVAICEYGVHTVAAKYIMKCDDDTFVRLESVMKEITNVPSGKSLYVGNINYYHKPLRSGKWAVTYEEWPEEDYPPYANGPGYVVSSDIAQFIVSEFENHTLRLFKMEDVSMGMWVEKFNSTKSVEYIHSDKYCQFGCIDDYHTAHYQSPRQMLCMWEKLKAGKPQCCNMR